MEDVTCCFHTSFISFLSIFQYSNSTRAKLVYVLSYLCPLLLLLRRFSINSAEISPWLFRVCVTLKTFLITASIAALCFKNHVLLNCYVDLKMVTHSALLYFPALSLSYTVRTITPNCLEQWPLLVRDEELKQFNKKARHVITVSNTEVFLLEGFCSFYFYPDILLSGLVDHCTLYLKLYKVSVLFQRFTSLLYSVSNNRFWEMLFKCAWLWIIRCNLQLSGCLAILSNFYYLMGPLWSICKFCSSCPTCTIHRCYSGIQTSLMQLVWGKTKEPCV